MREIVLDDDESDDTSEYIVQSESNPTILHIAESKYLSLINRLSQSQIAPVEPIGPQVVEETTPSEGVSKTDDTVSVL